MQSVYFCYIFRAFPKGVVHRDLKMANIMLAENTDDTYTAKITDFGLAIENRTHPCHYEFMQKYPYYLQPPEELFQCMSERNRKFVYSVKDFLSVRCLISV